MSNRNDPVWARLDALAASSNALRNLQNKLSLAVQTVPSLPVANPVPGRLDDRFWVGALTRPRRSVLPRQAINRMISEKYPIAQPPVVDFNGGTNSRHIGREPKVTWK